MMKCVSILGSTGSIGRQSLDVIKRMDIRVCALTAGTNVTLMAQQCRQFCPALAVMATADAAQELKKQIGAVYDHPEPKYVEVKGRCMTQGLPKLITISSREMIEALAEPTTEILNAVCQVIERTPPELLGDILHNGIVMTGGGSLLYGFDQLVTRVTGIHTRVADNAVSCVAVGTGMSLDHLDLMPEGTINLSRERKVRL